MKWIVMFTCIFFLQDGSTPGVDFKRVGLEPSFQPCFQKGVQNRSRIVQGVFRSRVRILFGT